MCRHYLSGHLCQGLDWSTCRDEILRGEVPLLSHSSQCSDLSVSVFSSLFKSVWCMAHSPAFYIRQDNRHALHVVAHLQSIGYAQDRQRPEHLLQGTSCTDRGYRLIMEQNHAGACGNKAPAAAPASAKHWLRHYLEPYTEMHMEYSVDEGEDAVQEHCSVAPALAAAGSFWQAASSQSHRAVHCSAMMISSYRGRRTCCQCLLNMT